MDNAGALPTLLAVPNVSEGSDPGVVRQIGAAFEPARLLDAHMDPDHGRSVLTLAGRQGELAEALASGAAEAFRRIDLQRHHGSHPYVGALDVAPVVYLDDGSRGAAIAEALTAAALIGDTLNVPAFLYGDLATDPRRRERAALREGGPSRLAERIANRELEPDYGPQTIDPKKGAVLVTARPPLIAINVDLDTDDVELAKRTAASLRESGGGFEGVRALGLYLPERKRAQVSMNVHDHRRAPLRDIVAAIAREAPIAEVELVGLAPKAAFEGFPEDLPMRDFDPRRHLIENALGSLD